MAESGNILLKCQNEECALKYFGNPEDVCPKCNGPEVEVFEVNEEPVPEPEG